MRISRLKFSVTDLRSVLAMLGVSSVKVELSYSKLTAELNISFYVTSGVAPPGLE